MRRAAGLGALAELLRPRGAARAPRAPGARGSAAEGGGAGSRGLRARQWRGGGGRPGPLDGARGVGAPARSGGFGAGAARLPEIGFEDLVPEGPGPLGPGGPGGPGGAEEEEAPGGSGGGGPGPRAAPVPDERLADLDPRLLPRDQLVWVAGRAATLGIASAGLWRGVAEAIEALGESQLSPSELCRLVQAFAYAPRGAPMDSRQLQRLMKAFATRSEEYSDERLARVIYGYAKLAAKRGLRLQKFLDFVSSEVLERSTKLRGWPSFRILQSVWNLEGTSTDFRTALASQAMKKVDSLDLASLHAFAPMLVELGYHARPGVVDRLNSVFKRRLHTYREPELLLRAGLALLLQDLLKATTVALWLQRLADAGAPAGRGAGALEALKLAELCLRHERSALLAGLPPRARRFLVEVRSAVLDPPEGHRMPEPPFVFGELGRLCGAAGLLLHPTLLGPYLLELADPFGHVVVEWDTSWLLYPPWRRAQQMDFVRRKHRHLAAEGWRVLCVPLAEFQSLASTDEKMSYLNTFIEKHDLGHLRLPV